MSARPIPMVAEIQVAVCAYYGMSMHDLLSEKRAREFVRPRQLGMYLAREMTSQSLPQIGQRFGGRDHSTVVHAIAQIRALRTSIPEIGHHLGDVREIASQIASRRQLGAA